MSLIPDKGIYDKITVPIYGCRLKSAKCNYCESNPNQPTSTSFEIFKDKDKWFIKKYSDQITIKVDQKVLNTKPPLELTSNSGLYFNESKIPQWITILETDYIKNNLKIERQSFIESKHLGKGGFGEVKLGFNKKYCKPVAIKKLIHDNQKIGAESKFILKLNHKNINRALLFDNSTPPNYIILEFANGGSITEEKKSLEETQNIMFQVALGIRYLHSEQFVHRDLKPDNLLIHHISKDKYLVKIADFGISKLLHETQPRTIIGTRKYSSPESGKIVDYGNNVSLMLNIDCWSYGVMLFEFLTGENPFHNICEPKYDTSFEDELLTPGNDSWEDSPKGGKGLLDKMKEFELPIMAQELICNTIIIHKKRWSSKQILQSPWFSAFEEMHYGINNRFASSDDQVHIQNFGIGSCQQVSCLISHKSLLFILISLLFSFHQMIKNCGSWHLRMKE